MTVVAPGINGKMNELQAALGLSQLQYVENALAERFAIDRKYREALDQTRGIELRLIRLQRNTTTATFRFWLVLNIRLVGMLYTNDSATITFM